MLALSTFNIFIVEYYCTFIRSMFNHPSLVYCRESILALSCLPQTQNNYCKNIWCTAATCRI